MSRRGGDAPPKPYQSHRLSEAKRGNREEADNGPRVQDREHGTRKEEVLDEVAEVEGDAHPDDERRHDGQPPPRCLSHRPLRGYTHSPSGLRFVGPPNPAFSCERRINEGGREAPAIGPPLVSCNALLCVLQFIVRRTALRCHRRRRVPRRRRTELARLEERASCRRWRP